MSLCPANGMRNTWQRCAVCCQQPLLGEIPHLPDVERQTLGPYLDISLL